MNLGALVQTFGYPLVFLGAIAEGEFVLMAAGFMIHRGYLDWWWVWPLAMLGGTTGDQTYFHLGRRYGERLIARLPRITRIVPDRARDLIRRRPQYVLLFMRFLVGMRMLLPVLCGMGGIKVVRFTTYNVLTALVWSALFIGLGYLYGTAAARIFKRVEDIELVLLAVLLIAVVASHQLRRRHGEKPN